MVDDLMGRQVGRGDQWLSRRVNEFAYKTCLKRNPGREDVLNRDDIRFLKPIGYFSFNKVE